MADATYPEIDAWAHSGIITVSLEAVGDLPASVVDLRLPDLTAFIAAGRIPNPLLPMAMKVEQDGVFEDKLTTPEEVRDYFDLQCYIIATHLVKPDLVGQLGEDGAIQWVKQNMPAQHRRTLWLRAMHLDLTGFVEGVKTLMEAATFPAGSPGAGVPDGNGAAGKGAV